MLAAGAPWARLTGAGPTLFSMLPSQDAARRVLAGLGEPERSWVAPTLPRPPDWLT